MQGVKRNPRNRIRRERLARNRDLRLLIAAGALALESIALALSGCGGSGGAAAAASATASVPPPTQPVVVGVSVSPPNGNVLIGMGMQFSATVSNATNSAVMWSVDGIPGGNPADGTVSSSGMYVAPQVLPQSAEVVAATSVSDPTKSGTASITITSDVGILVSPANATVVAGGQQQFAAVISSAGNPSKSVTWSVNGVTGGTAALGTISASGLFIAPQTITNPLSVTVQARSDADPNKAATAAVSIATTQPNPVSVAISPAAATVSLGSLQVFTATVSGTAGGVTWDVNGSASGNSSIGTLTTGGAGPNAILYTAPGILFSGPITLRAASAANPATSATASISLISGITVGVSPAAASVAIGQRQTVFASVTGSPDAAVTWAVNGVAGGSPAFGQICSVGSNPCQPVSMPATGAVEFLAPAGVPSPNPVQLTAASEADPSKSGVATITILPHLVVSVSPPSAAVAANSAVQFSANVMGSPDQGVTWNVSGAACGTAGACGQIDGSGRFTAPVSAPSPDAITISATSEVDTSRSGTAAVMISTAPVITQLLPASAAAGAAGGFSLRTLGGNFVAGAGGSGSVIAISGIPRTTICASAGDCSTTLTAADLLLAGSLPIQIRNPDGSSSPSVSFVVAAANGPASVIALSASSPVASGVDITVVDRSSAGSTLPAANATLSIQAIGVFSSASNNCELGGGAVELQRPASGAAAMDVCAFSVSGLDPSFVYSLSGPATPDVKIAATQSLEFGIVDLTLIVPSSAQPGTRTLFVQNANKDLAAASGALVVR